MRGQAQIALHLIELQRQYDTERIALPVELTRLQRLVHAAERHHSGIRAQGLEEVGGDGAARAAELQPGKIVGCADRSDAGGQVVKPVLPAMVKGVEGILGEFAADPVAERAVERGEHRFRIGEREREQR